MPLSYIPVNENVGYICTMLSLPTSVAGREALLFLVLHARITISYMIRSCFQKLSEFAVWALNSGFSPIEDVERTYLHFQPQPDGEFLASRSLAAHFIANTYLLPTNFSCFYLLTQSTSIQPYLILFCEPLPVPPANYVCSDQILSTTTRL